jgi:hypothetical protein
MNPDISPLFRNKNFRLGGVYEVFRNVLFFYCSGFSIFINKGNKYLVGLQIS